MNSGSDLSSPNPAELSDTQRELQDIWRRKALGPQSFIAPMILKSIVRYGGPSESECLVRHEYNYDESNNKGTLEMPGKMFRAMWVLTPMRFTIGVATSWRFSGDEKAALELELAKHVSADLLNRVNIFYLPLGGKYF
ncbi:hypothetical protein PG984_006585 [Apiospora sp. TS-2023a]